MFLIQGNCSAHWHTQCKLYRFRWCCTFPLHMPRMLWTAHQGNRLQRHSRPCFPTDRSALRRSRTSQHTVCKRRRRCSCLANTGRRCCWCCCTPPRRTTRRSTLSRSGRRPPRRGSRTPTDTPRTRCRSSTGPRGLRLRLSWRKEDTSCCRRERKFLKHIGCTRSSRRPPRNIRRRTGCMQWWLRDCRFPADRRRRARLRWSICPQSTAGTHSRWSRRPCQGWRSATR